MRFHCKTNLTQCRHSEGGGKEAPDLIRQWRCRSDYALALGREDTDVFPRLRPAEMEQ
jgi:hypothetical protein